MESHVPYDERDEQVYRDVSEIPPWQRVYLDGEDVTDRSCGLGRGTRMPRAASRKDQVVDQAIELASGNGIQVREPAHGGQRNAQRRGR